MGLELPPMVSSLTVATWETATFVLSQVGKKLCSGDCKLCASPFMLDCENSGGVLGPRSRGSGPAR